MYQEQLRSERANKYMLRYGQWVPLIYTVQVKFDNGTTGYKTVKVQTFITNTDLVREHSGIIGVGNCGENMKEYSFLHQITDGKIESFRYEMASQIMNSD